MKNDIKKVITLAMTVFVAFGLFSAGGISASAENDDNWKLVYQKPLYAGQTTWVDVVYSPDTSDIATITSATSSDKTVLAVKKEVYGEFTYFYLKAKKAGSVKLTVNYTTPGGDKGTMTKTVKVRKYPKMIKSLKVNGKKVKTSKHKYDYVKKTGKTSIKIKMALKKGWKIRRVYADRAKKDGKYKEFKVSKKALLKGTAIKFPKKYKNCCIMVTLEKGKDSISYTINFYR